MISIVIPAYMQPGKGESMLIVLLNSIQKQDTPFKYEVCISDNDDTGKIAKVCDQFSKALPIVYKHNPVKGASENFNNAIEMAKYDKIKPMCMDDAFYSLHGLLLFSEALDKNGWVISNSVHINEYGNVYGRRFTKYDHNHMESNQTGMPSVVGFRKCSARFDPMVKTFCDTYFYYQLYELYGHPAVLTSFTIACRFWGGSLSHNQPSHKKEDLEYLRLNNLIHC